MEAIIYRAVETALEQFEYNKKQEDQDDLVDFIMRSQELCNYLKMKMSTLYQLTHKNEIPFNKRGKTLYFKKDEIDK